MTTAARRRTLVMRLADRIYSLAGFGTGETLPRLDRDDMPDWQQRDLGFRDGNPSIRDDILMR